MGWWSDRVVPRIADKALDTAEVREMRPRVCAGLRGDVAEVGFGSGLNVVHYPSEVTGVWGSVALSDSGGRVEPFWCRSDGER